ncbi:MAG: sugar ABC transporter ATP-binding protein [Spirochaetia bacterium]|jgi:ribose transport system ATP-binding protein|nr:sugar ABC transporter ATP-binding protein [Spirochaetia bacterium]
MASGATILQLKNIVKLYPGVKALDNVSLDIAQGEIHALVGENGAGKSTLIKTCTGAVIPTKGTIHVNGKEFTSMTPKLSEENGIAAIYQEFNLVGELSVAENIFLGRAIRKGITIDTKAMVERTKELFEQLEIRIDPNKLVKELAVGYQQLVEITKALSQNAKVLIMDEPTAPLTKTEVALLFAMIGRLRKSGLTIIYISHRMDEIFTLSDRITVLRDGQMIKTLVTKDTNVDEVVKLMVGRTLSEHFPPRENVVTDETLLSLDNVSGNGVNNISFAIKRGEILGLSGLIGSGRTEIAQLVFGVKKRTDGKMFFKGKEIHPKTPREAIDLGLALVPEDRKRQGALLSLSIKKNISIAILNRISKLSVVDRKAEDSLAKKYLQELRIKTPSENQLVRNLSGGNQQKVIVGKWLATQPDLIILDEPTRGIDVSAKFEIYKLMNALVEEGKTILMISSEMEELIGMSDRIIVLSEGRVTGELAKAEFNQERIMSYASIVQEKE